MWYYSYVWYLMNDVLINDHLSLHLLGISLTSVLNRKQKECPAGRREDSGKKRKERISLVMFGIILTGVAVYLCCLYRMLCSTKTRSHECFLQQPVCDLIRHSKIPWGRFPNWLVTQTTTDMRSTVDCSYIDVGLCGPPRKLFALCCRYGGSTITKTAYMSSSVVAEKK